MEVTRGRPPPRSFWEAGGGCSSSDVQSEWGCRGRGSGPQGRRGAPLEVGRWAESRRDAAAWAPSAPPLPGHSGRRRLACPVRDPRAQPASASCFSATARSPRDLRSTPLVRRGLCRADMAPRPSRGPSVDAPCLGVLGTGPSPLLLRPGTPVSASFCPGPATHCPPPASVPRGLSLTGSGQSACPAARGPRWERSPSPLTPPGPLCSDSPVSGERLVSDSPWPSA